MFEALPSNSLHIPMQQLHSSQNSLLSVSPSSMVYLATVQPQAFLVTISCLWNHLSVLEKVKEAPIFLAFWQDFRTEPFCRGFEVA